VDEGRPGLFVADGLREFAYHQTVRTIPPFLVWPMVYSEGEANRHIGFLQETHKIEQQPPYDFLFPHRASANGYTNHLAFMDAFERLNEHLAAQARCLFLDPTGYLYQSEKARLEEHRTYYHLAMAEDRRSYWQALSSCRVVAGTMADDLHGGVSLREAVRAGCFPVLLRNKAYTDMAQNMGCLFLTQYMAEDVGRDSIFRALKRAALEKPWTSTPMMAALAEGVQNESFEFAWSVTARGDIANLTGVDPAGWGKAIL
jgi:hypothetical protein